MTSSLGPMNRLADAILSAARMPGSLWETTKPPCFRLWREKRGRSGTGGPLGQPRRPARGRHRSAEPALVRAQHWPGRYGSPAARPASRDPVSRCDLGRSGRRTPGRYSSPSSCSHGRSPKRRRRKSTSPSSSTTCGSRTPRTAALSIITGGGKWVELTIPADSLYQHLLLTAEKKFWRCVQSGEPPRLFLAEPPKVRIEAIRIVDMSSSNSWAEFAGVFRRTHAAFLEHEGAKAELKKLMPEDAREAIGHGIRAKRSKSGAVSFELSDREAGGAALQ